jgi:monoamine oxidase
MECDILVIGAGAAGIAAARAITRTTRSVHVLEARSRVGGRGLTSFALGPAFDLGATWLHAADRNPLVRLATGLGVALHDSDALRREVTFIGDRRASPEDQAAYDAAWTAFEEAIHARARDPAIASVAEAAPANGPWDATIAAWQGEVIAAAPLAAMDLHDFAANLLTGANLLPAGGLGTLLARLASNLPITTEAAVTRLRWGGLRAIAEGSFGRLSARAVICTLPTSLIATQTIGFEPALPDALQQAARDLPLGAAIKVGLRAAGTDRLGLPDHSATDRLVTPGESLVPITFWPLGEPIAQGWIGGELARDVEREGPGAAEAVMRQEIAARLGHDAPRAFAPGALVSDWLGDPFARGVYSHARMGAAGARAALAAPLAGGRLVFAGEACHPTLAGTVGGAWLSGEKAAALALAALEG